MRPRVIDLPLVLELSPRVDEQQPDGFSQTPNIPIGQERRHLEDSKVINRLASKDSFLEER